MPHVVVSLDEGWKDDVPAIMWEDEAEWEGAIVDSDKQGEVDVSVAAKLEERRSGRETSPPLNRRYGRGVVEMGEPDTPLPW
jgi:hypothetical protein